MSTLTLEELREGAIVKGGRKGVKEEWVSVGVVLKTY